MQPQYFIENRYSYIIDALQVINNENYEVDTPETEFERSVQSQLAQANQLLMQGKYSTALAKYLYLRGVIAAVINPHISVTNGSLIDWAKINQFEMIDALVAKAADILKNTPVLQSAIPEKLRIGDIKLPDNVIKQFASIEEIGLRDRDVRIGVLLGEVGILIEHKEFTRAADIYQAALRETTNRELQAALMHDLAVMQERSGNRSQALVTMQRSASMFEQARDYESQVAVLSNLAGMQARGGTTDAANATLKLAEELRQKYSLIPVSTGGLTKSSTDLLKYQPAGAVKVDSQLKLGLSTGKLGTIIPTRPGTPTSTTTATATMSLEELKAQPVQLVSASAFAARRTQKQLAIQDSEGKVRRIVLDNNGPKNLAAFYEHLQVTSDLGLLMGYLANYTITVAYLPHVYHWVIPMAIGDCHAALGSYGEAETEYLSTLNYKYLNQTVETVNLWLRLTDLYLDWGDRLYRQALNDVSRFGRAREKYELLMRLNNTIDLNSPLYKSQKFASLRSRINAVIQAVFIKGTSINENPRIIMALLRAKMQLTKISNELNFIGLGVHIPPFSFEYLQNLARYFTQHASQVEQMYIQFQSTGENEKLREQQMAQQADIAAASVELERRGLDEAREGVNVAQANLNYADVQRQNAMQAANDFANARWELLELDSLQAWASASAVDSSDQVRLTISNYTYYNASKKKRNEVLQDLTYQRTRLTHDLEANRLQREINAANAYRGVAQQQVQLAQARVEIARQRIAIAQMQEQFARENLEFLKGREFSSAMWYNLAREARRLTRRYLDMAIEVATMMEKAYEAETGRDLRKIKFEYGLDHLKGLLGAEALLLDIEYFTLDYVRTKSKKAQMKQTISLADNFPMAFTRLLLTGRTFFETTMEHFDRRYPGFYLNKVKQVEVVFVGLTGTEGVHGTLRNIGLSQFRRKNGAIVNQTYPADVMPLSEYNVRQDALVFQLDSKELRLFENNGVATMWQLDLPRSTNTFDLRQILDIHLVIYYDGFFDAGLEQQLLAALPAGGSASRGISLRLYAPDELYFLRGKGSAELSLTPDLFPANHTNHRLKNYTLQAVGDNVAGLRVRVDFAGPGVSHTFQLDSGGNASGAVFTVPLNRSLFDTWTITIDSDNNPGFNLSGLADVAVFLEYEFNYRS